MIIFFYGEDTFCSYEKVLEIKKKFFQNDKSCAGLSLFDMDDSSQDTLEKMRLALSFSGLFSPKKLLIFKKIISLSPNDEQTKILKFLQENTPKLKTDTDTVLLFWEKGLPRKNNALFKFLLINAKKQNFEKLAGLRLKKWILTKIKSLSPATVISTIALEKLIAYVGNDTALLTQEIEKLINFSGSDIIGDNTIDLLIKDNLDNNIFETIEALSANKKQKALELLHRHFDRGDDPFYLFSMFVYQFRNLLHIASLWESGIFNEFEIAKLAKLHPYVVKKSFMQAKYFGEEKLAILYEKLGALDVKIKTGQIDSRLSLDKFIVEL